MNELTLHTGCAGESMKIHIDWHDHNNIRRISDLEILIQNNDKPRTLELRLNDVVVATIPSI